jgi:hypothetical protein
MSSFMALRSQQISLAERSCSRIALVVYCLCVGEDVSPSFSNANEGYQWKVQTDEG